AGKYFTTAAAGVPLPDKPAPAPTARLAAERERRPSQAKQVVAEAGCASPPAIAAQSRTHRSPGKAEPAQPTPRVKTPPARKPRRWLYLACVLVTALLLAGVVAVL